MPPSVVLSDSEGSGQQASAAFVAQMLRLAPRDKYRGVATRRGRTPNRCSAHFSLAHAGRPRIMARMMIVRALYIVGGFLFLLSLIAYVYVRVRLRPREGSDLDDYYHEFEEQHPEYARYTKWMQLSLGGAA